MAELKTVSAWPSTQRIPAALGGVTAKARSSSSHLASGGWVSTWARTRWPARRCGSAALRTDSAVGLRAAPARGRDCMMPVGSTEAVTQ